MDHATARMAQLEQRVDEWEIDAANGKTAASTQVRSLRAEVTTLASELGGMAAHNAFAGQLDEAREQYERFNRFSEHLVREFAELKERVSTAENVTRQVATDSSSGLNQASAAAMEERLERAVQVYPV